jgi:voltage-gated potassium channel
MKNIGRMCTDPTHKNYQLWQTVVNIFIMASCMGLALETVSTLWFEYKTPFIILEWVSVSVFTIDYIANLFCSEKKFQYAFSLWGLIDLISILPSYLMLLNLSALQGAKMLRLLRIARILRLLKTVVQTQTSNPLIINLKIYLIIFFSVMMISSTAMYAVEGTLYSLEKMEIGQKKLDAQAKLGEEAEVFMPLDPISGTPIPEDKRFFTSIPTAMWWCIVTLTSTGYGDIYPVTVKGRIVAGITMFLGLVLFGILLNLVGKTLMVILFDEKLKPDD